MTFLPVCNAECGNDGPVESLYDSGARNEKVRRDHKSPSESSRMRGRASGMSYPFLASHLGIYKTRKKGPEDELVRCVREIGRETIPACLACSGPWLLPRSHNTLGVESTYFKGDMNNAWIQS